MSNFFLSHARNDVDSYFETFVKDFCDDLRSLLGLDTVEGIGFRDTSNIPLGAAWEPRIEQALRTCKTFIAMLSPTYVKRPSCGMEWASFAWRRSQAVNPPDVLLPLVWVPIPEPEMPAAVKAIQFNHATLGATYRDRGLKFIVQRGGIEYLDFRDTFAGIVANLVRQNTLLVSPPLPNLDTFDNPFERAQAIAVAAGNTAAGGPKRVEFVIVAGSHSELQAIRNVLVAYGVESDDWQPWAPDFKDPVSVQAQGVAAGAKLNSMVVSAAKDLKTRLETAKAKNTMVILLVDVWSLCVDVYSDYMREFDGQRFLNSAVLVLWNTRDDETKARQKDLLDRLQFSFPNLSVVKDPQAFYEMLPGPNEFESALQNALLEVRRRITDLGQVGRRAQGQASIPQPVLASPGGSR